MATAVEGSVVPVAMVQEFLTAFAMMDVGIKSCVTIFSTIGEVLSEPVHVIHRLQHIGAVFVAFNLSGIPIRANIALTILTSSVGLVLHTSVGVAEGGSCTFCELT